MSNSNDNLKNRFMERHVKLSAAIPIILESIRMVENINPETNYTEKVLEFISKMPNYDVSDGELYQINFVLIELISGKLQIEEARAYLNYIHDVVYFKAMQMLVIQDIFKCYF
ncbi:MAG: hypothetical protein IJ272_08300 [Clostridia bacterium]|nr:hypothetical protein [Clostridia bacterium]